MPKDLKDLKLPIKKIFLKYKKPVIVLLFILVILFLSYVVYNYFFLIIISPKPIDRSEIVAHREQVNTKLFQSIESKINKKMQVNWQEINNIKNPFK